MKHLLWLLLWQLTGTAFSQNTQLVTRIRAHMKETIEGVPNYTCQQLIERYRRESNTKKLEKLDALRLDVAVVNKHELFAWPGQNHFQESDFTEFSKRGAFGTGNFVTHLANALGGVGVTYTDYGEADFAGKKAYRIGYSISATRKPYSLKIGGNSGIAGVAGQLWVDVDTFDVLRLDLAIKEIPTNIPLLGTKEFIEYSRVQIGSGNFLLPKKAELQLDFIDGQIDQNKTTFSGCRQYSGESTIRFDDPAIADETIKTAKEISVPPGTSFSVELKSRIDSTTAAVGDAIEALVVRAVKVKGQVIIPKGAIISGRLSRMERTVFSGFQVRIIGFEWNKLGFENKFANLRLSVEEGGSILSSKLPNRPVAGRSRIFIYKETGNTPATAIYAQGTHLELTKGFLMVVKVF